MREKVGGGMDGCRERETQTDRQTDRQTERAVPGFLPKADLLDPDSLTAQT